MYSLISSLIVATEARREQAQGMVEYGLILALVAVVALAALTGIGTQVSSVFSQISHAL